MTTQKNTLALPPVLAALDAEPEPTVIAPLSDAELDEHVAAIRRDGFVVFRDAIPKALLVEICREIMRLNNVRPGGDLPPMPFGGYVTRRWFDLLNDGEVWQRVATHPWILQIQQRILGEGFLLGGIGTTIIGPGEPAQPVHVDDKVYELERPHPDLVCNSMWALTDFTEENGATRIVPGSNNRPTDPVLGTAYETVPMEMPAGSIGVFLGSCYHGAGANQSNRDRWGLTVAYNRGTMRSQENFMLSVSPGRLMSFPSELQDILGFKSCQGVGQILASDPRSEMERHYGDWPAEDPYLAGRDSYHQQRLAATEARRPTRAIYNPEFMPKNAAIGEAGQ